MLLWHAVKRNVLERAKVEKVLAESEEKYRKLIATANDAILLADVHTGTLIDANKKAEELIGLPMKGIISLHQTKLHPPEDAEKYQHIFTDAVRRGGNNRFDAEIQHQSGHRIPVQISSSIIQLGEKEIIMGIFRDVTALKKAEDILRRDKEFLEKEIDKKVQELTKAQKKLENARRLSDIGTLSTTVAHELRNPLGAISIAVHNIKVKSAKNQDFTSHLVNIDKKISESNQIIKNLLTYSRIKMPHFENISILKVLKESINHCEDKYTKFDITVNLSHNWGSEDLIPADPLHMSELFINILDNAYQAYPNKEGKIDVKLDCNKKHNKVDIYITDYGVGLHENDLPKVFEPFFTLKSKGIGLGLTVCRQIVDLHAGRLSVKSMLGTGTEVYIFLPFKRDDSEDTQEI